MKVIVTGGAGFIGSNFVRYLIRERPSWRLVVLDSLSYAANLDVLRSSIDDNTISFCRVDIGDLKSVQACFKEHQPDYVAHLAAESHVDRSIENPAQFVFTNVVGTQNLLHASRIGGVKKFLHVSTDEVYGSLGEEGRFLETTPLDPSSPYSSSKAASDLIALAYHRTYGEHVVVTRCTNNYGPYQFPEKFIPLFTIRALQDEPLPLYGTGVNVRSWLHVEDHCEALLLALEHGRAGEVYNIGGMHEAERPNKEVATAICTLLGKPESLVTLVKDRLGHDYRYAIDYSKIKSELGWTPRTVFEDGLRRTVEWYTENKGWWSRIKEGTYQDHPEYSAM
jgi:dTDP-glucose 4,6-dehydratase